MLPTKEESKIAWENEQEIRNKEQIESDRESDRAIDTEIKKIEKEKMHAEYRASRIKDYEEKLKNGTWDWAETFSYSVPEPLKARPVQKSFSPQNEQLPQAMSGLSFSEPIHKVSDGVSRQRIDTGSGNAFNDLVIKFTSFFGHWHWH